MFAQHIKPQILENLQVIHHGLQSRRRVQPVRPETLVQRAEQEPELAVQQRPHDPVDRALRDRAEARVAADVVGAEGYADVVQVGGLGGPELGIGYGENELFVCRAGVCGDLLGAFFDGDFYRPCIV